jgi:hypothetical protein
MQALHMITPRVLHFEASRRTTGHTVRPLWPGGQTDLEHYYYLIESSAGLVLWPNQQTLHARHIRTTPSFEHVKHFTFGS